MINKKYPTPFENQECFAPIEVKTTSIITDKGIFRIESFSNNDINIYHNNRLLLKPLQFTEDNKGNKYVNGCLILE